MEGALEWSRGKSNATNGNMGSLITLTVLRDKLARICGERVSDYSEEESSEDNSGSASDDHSNESD